MIYLHSSRLTEPDLHIVVERRRAQTMAAHTHTHTRTSVRTLYMLKYTCTQTNCTTEAAVFEPIFQINLNAVGYCTGLDI